MVHLIFVAVTRLPVPLKMTGLTVSGVGPYQCSHDDSDDADGMVIVVDLRADVTVVEGMGSEEWLGEQDI